MKTHYGTNVDVELIRYSAESAIILTVNAQASLGRVRRNNSSKEFYGSESTFKKSGGSNTNGNSSSNSKPNSGSSGRSNNFNGSAGSVASGSNTFKSASGLPQPFSEEQEVNLPVGGRLFHFKKVVSGLKVHVLSNFKPVHNPIPISIPECPKSEYFKSEISNWSTLLTQWNGKEIILFPSYDYFLTADASESGAGATLKKGNKIIKTWSFQWSTTQSNMSSNRREILALWSNPRSISPLRTTLEAVSQEESQLDWRPHSRILQCQSRPSRPF
ncbi:hypothetical protein ACTFIV_005204 [Dictyostelium citrinum]